jgi:hypothetical protein
MFTSHAAAIAEQLLENCSSKSDFFAVRGYLRLEGNPERTLKGVVKQLAKHKNNGAAADFLQSVLSGTNLSHHNVREMLEDLEWKKVEMPPNEEVWAVVAVPLTDEDLDLVVVPNEEEFEMI